MRLEVLKGTTITGFIDEPSDDGVTFIYGEGDRFFVKFSNLVDEIGIEHQPKDLVDSVIDNAEFEDGELRLDINGDQNAIFYDVEDLTDTNGNTFEDFAEDGANAGDFDEEY